MRLADPRAYGYIRVSHENSAFSGISPEAQKREVIAYHDAMPWDIPWGDLRYPAGEQPGFICDYAQSAWGWKSRFAKRPGGSQLRKTLRGGDHLLFYSLDRGFRSVRDFTNTIPCWLDEGINVHFTSNRFNLATANGKMLAHVLAAYAQWKSDMLSERMRDAAARRREKAGKTASVERDRSPWLPSNLPLWTNEQIIKMCLPGRVFSYGRASHLDSVMSGAGLDAQRVGNERYATYLMRDNPQLRFSGHHEELAVSAYSQYFRQRPTGQFLDSILESGDHVVFWRLDRAWRNLRDMLETVANWRQRGITAHFADQMLDTSSTMGDIFLRLMCMFAEFESEFLSQRGKLVAAETKRQGRPVNQEKPIGTKAVKTARGKFLAPDREEIDMAWWITHLREQYNLSFYKISDLVESALAKRDGRKVIPRGGIWDRSAPLTKGTKKSKNIRLRHRPWGWSRCRHAYNTFSTQIRKFALCGVKDSAA